MPAKSAKSRSPRKVTKTKSSNWKRIGIPLLIALSIALNVIFVGLIVVYKAGVLDYAVINHGFDTLCSDDYRERVTRDAERGGYDAREAVAYVDFTCDTDDARPYRDKATDEYLESLGIERDS